MKKLFIFLALSGLLPSCGGQAAPVTELVVIGQDTTMNALSSPVSEFEFKGCEYLIWRSSFVHKGNCRNPIHY